MFENNKITGTAGVKYTKLCLYFRCDTSPSSLFFKHLHIFVLLDHITWQIILHIIHHHIHHFNSLILYIIRNIWNKIYCNISKIDVLLTFHIASDNLPREASIPLAARRNDWGKWICGRLSRFLKDAKVVLMPAPGNTIPVRRLLNENRWPLIAEKMVSKQLYYTIHISIIASLHMLTIIFIIYIIYVEWL